MKGLCIDDCINFLRGIEWDWKDWFVGKKIKFYWIFFVGVLIVIGMLIFSFWLGNQRFVVVFFVIGIVFIFVGLLQSGEIWEEKIQKKIWVYELFDIDVMCILVVFVFYKDELMQEEFRQWLDVEFSVILDVVFCDGCQLYFGDIIN